MDLSKIKAFAFDVDGVFTDGGVLCVTGGELYRTFDAKDGFAVRMAVMHDYPVAIITGGRSESIRDRFLTSGLKAENIYLRSRKKVEQLDDFCSKHGLERENVLFIGDDIPDIEVIQAAGLGVCPSDAVPEVLASADFVSSRPGGHGCVREAIEMVMKAQGAWTFDADQYKKLF